jgi:hypothetical protein
MIDHVLACLTGRADNLIEPTRQDLDPSRKMDRSRLLLAGLTIAC